MLRLGVVGVGHLGKFHAEKCRAMEGVELVGVADISHRRAGTIASRLDVQSFFSHKDLLGRVDAVSVVVPTHDHFTVARDFLAAGVHVLVEKPITRTLEEADALIALAKENDLALQVGHVERFNPAMAAAFPLTGRPLFIEANRIGSFPQRGSDIDVVLDLMIHDIDIALHLVQEDPQSIQAVGVPVVSPRVDIANARLEFGGGCVANLTASRISNRSQRKVRVFQRDAYLSIDYIRHEVNVVRRLPPDASGLSTVKSEKLPVSPGDALEKEIKSFVQAVTTRSAPVVSGEDGRRALAVTIRILADIRARQGDWFDGQES